VLLMMGFALLSVAYSPSQVDYEHMSVVQKSLYEASRIYNELISYLEWQIRNKVKDPNWKEHIRDAVLDIVHYLRVPYSGGYLYARVDDRALRSRIYNYDVDNYIDVEKEVRWLKEVEIYNVKGWFGSGYTVRIDEVSVEGVDKSGKEIKVIDKNIDLPRKKRFKRSLDVILTRAKVRVKLHTLKRTAFVQLIFKTATVLDITSPFSKVLDGISRVMNAPTPESALDQLKKFASFFGTNAFAGVGGAYHEDWGITREDLIARLKKIRFYMDGDKDDWKKAKELLDNLIDFLKE